VIAGIRLVAWKDWSLRLRDRWSLMSWLAIPLMIGVMITALTGGQGGPSLTARVLLVDEDDSFASRMLATALGQPTGDRKLIDVIPVDRSEGRRRIEAGEASALLVVPEGFGAAVLEERPMQLELVTNPAQRILPGIVEEYLKVLADGAFYLHRVFGDQLGTIDRAIEARRGGRVFDDAKIAQLSVSINDTIEGLAGYLDPPLLGLAEAGPADTGEAPGPLNFALVYFPSLVFMGLLFTAQGLAEVFWRERDNGTLRRQVASPLGLGEILLGKMVAAAAMLFVLTGLLATAGFAWHRLAPGMWLPTVAWMTLSGLLLYGLMALIQLLSPTRRSASLITMVLVFPLAMMGGAFFPVEALPQWMSEVSRWVPNGYLLARLKEYLIYGAGPAELWSGLLFAVPVTVGLWVLCAWRLRAFATRV